MTENVILKGQLKQSNKIRTEAIASATLGKRTRPLVRYAEKYGHLSVFAIGQFGLARAIELANEEDQVTVAETHTDIENEENEATTKRKHIAGSPRSSIK